MSWYYKYFCGIGRKAGAFTSKPLHCLVSPWLLNLISCHYRKLSPSLKKTDSVISPGDTFMFSIACPLNHGKNLPTRYHPVFYQPHFYALPLPQIPQRRAWGWIWLGLWMPCKMFVTPVCPCPTPLAVTPATLGCDISRAGAVFALVGTAPQGWSVDRGLQAHVI